ncbi:MAG: hypothetical protein JSV03_11680 [Planctomycetota bacterium]|nr:MAG: hypothetical protein JSV03_11680 [Planctomycetota bacterium]
MSGSVVAQSTTQPYSLHKLVAMAETKRVPESSGVIASRVSKDIFWTHNDSGRYAPRVWAFRLSKADRTRGVAKHMGYVELVGAAIIDWEDIAVGPKNRIYILDGGDGIPCRRTNKKIYRFVEPRIDPAGAAIALKKPCDSTRFEYPDLSNPSRPAGSNDQRYDAESLFVHPTNGDIYLVTKHDNRNKASARIYKLPASKIKWNTGAINVLQFVADVSSKVPNMPVAADIDKNGRRVVIRNYASAYEFTLSQDMPFDTIFQRIPKVISLSFELQGEGICYGPNGDLITTTEGVTSPHFKIYVTPRRADKVHSPTSTASVP